MAKPTSPPGQQRPPGQQPTTSGNASPDAVNDTGFSTAYDTNLDILTSQLSNNDTGTNKNDILTITGVTSGAGGTATLSADGTKVTFDPTAGFSGDGTFTYALSNGRGGTDTATVTVAVGAPPPVPVNDAPVVSNASVHSAHTEGSAPIVVANGITLADVDDTHLEAALVYFSSIYGFFPGEDHLGFVNQNGITGTFGQTPNELHLTGSATVADYQAALRSVTYSNLSENPTAITEDRLISFLVFDGEAWSTPQSASAVTVVPVNDAPTVANPLPDATAKEGQGFSYTVPANTFVDVDGGGAFSYLVAKGDGTALPGWLNFDAATRTFSGTPDYDAQGTLTVIVTAQEAGGGLTGTDRFDIVVQDTPVATPPPAPPASQPSLSLSAGPVATVVDDVPYGSPDYTVTDHLQVTTSRANQYNHAEAHGTVEFGATAAPNQVSGAKLNLNMTSVISGSLPNNLDVYLYVGDGRVDLNDFGQGSFAARQTIDIVPGSYGTPQWEQTITLDAAVVNRVLAAGDWVGVSLRHDDVSVEGQDQTFGFATNPTLDLFF